MYPVIPITNISSHPLLDELQEALSHVVTALGEDLEDGPLRVRPAGFPARSRSERVYQIEGPDDFVVRVRFGVYPLGDGTYEVYVDLDEGPTCRFTCDATGGRSETAEERSKLGRKVAAALFREIEPHLGPRTRCGSSTGESTSKSLPLLVLDREGVIVRMNEQARTVMEDEEGPSRNPNFLSRVHGQNLRRVFRDLARMVQNEMQRARWLLRLEAGSGRWRWYRAEVLNRLETDGTIRVHLHGLGSASSDR